MLIIFSFSSCKKDRLKDEKSILEGKWKWIFTNEGINDPNYWVNKTPLTEGKSYSVEFLKCGKIKFYEDGQEKDIYRIVFANFDPCDPAYGICWGFEIYLNNKGENNILGSIWDRNVDTLKLRGNYGYPFSGTYYDGSVEKQYINYYIREN